MPGGQNSGRPNEVTVLPRWPYGGVSLCLIVTYLEEFWYLNSPCIRKSTSLWVPREMNSLFRCHTQWSCLGRHRSYTKWIASLDNTTIIPCPYLIKKLNAIERYKSGIYWLGISRYSMTGVSVGSRPPCWEFMDFIHWFLCRVCIIIA